MLLVLVLLQLPREQLQDSVGSLPSRALAVPLAWQCVGMVEAVLAFLPATVEHRVPPLPEEWPAVLAPACSALVALVNAFSLKGVPIPEMASTEPKQFCLESTACSSCRKEHIRLRAQHSALSFQLQALPLQPLAAVGRLECWLKELSMATELG